MVYQASTVTASKKRGPCKRRIRPNNQEVHARLNTQRKILQTLWVLWKQQRSFDSKTFLGTEAQPTAMAPCG